MLSAVAGIDCCRSPMGVHSGSQFKCSRLTVQPGSSALTAANSTLHLAPSHLAVATLPGRLAHYRNRGPADPLFLALPPAGPHRSEKTGTALEKMLGPVAV